MIGKVKQQVRGILENKYRQEYRRLWQERTCSYDRWIKEKEEGRDKVSPAKLKTAFFSYEELEKGETLWQNTDAEIICFVENKEMLREGAAQRLSACFAENEKLQAAYADEDEWSNGRESRMNPWYKPDYSPNTLLSWCYFGSLAAFRREALRDLSLEGLSTPRQRYYSLCLQACLPLKRDQVCHLKEILVTTPRITYWGFEDEYRPIKEAAKKRLSTVPAEGVSIIIPSKDNPDILAQCLESIRQYSDGMDVEVIVVDNGSGKEALLQIRELEKECGFRYIYEPMEFNFSRMCNRGAGESTRDLLLFLNDDCQARHEGWLKALAEQAIQSHVGAVGAKLYYPDSRMMQHCGVYSIYMGPAHKLQYRTDDRIYYDRRNRDVRNVLAVTGACLMMRKTVFSEVGGFDEKLQVAYNDVDLCWRLYERGYYNVLHNEIYLWHYESLSRGSDASPKKQKRLKGEQERLYTAHKALWNRDPYYHEYFTSDILDYNYSFAYEYDSRVEGVLKPELLKALPKKLREDDCVAPLFEYAGESTEWFAHGDSKMAKEELLYFQGSALVLGSDNACFELGILLLGETGPHYRILPKRRYRPDVVTNVEGQTNVDLSGFACLVETADIQEGTYELALLAKDRCSGQYLMKKANLKLCFSGGKGRRI
ncbi:MAG: glycosyltransferase [Lachnospiraceae bacterium]|nr:glycosyltransferase [Lachnospiraceae bacterium]